MRGFYRALIEPEMWAYVDRVEANFPPQIAGAPIEAQRRVYDAMCRTLHRGRPSGIHVSDGTLAAPDRAIPIRRYVPARGTPSALVLFFHGGGFVLGDLDSHDDICAEMSDRTGFEVVSVAYRLAPEHRHPAALDDAIDALYALGAQTALPFLFCGESSGATLAAALSHQARRLAVRPAGQLLITPDLGGDVTRGSYVRHAEAPLLTTRDVLSYRRMRGDGDAVPGLAPLRDDDFSDLPPTVIVTAECDPLCSDGADYRERILAAGGRATLIEEPRLTHSFLRARATVPRAQAAFSRIVEALAALGRMHS